MSRFENAYGMVVGVGDYVVSPTSTRLGFRNLPATVRDAQSIAAVLTDPYLCGYSAAHVHVLIGEQATSPNIRATLESLAKCADSESTVLLYFSGHGGQALENGIWRTYLCPREADPDNLSHTAIPGDEFSTLLAAISSRKQLVVLDACHAAGSINFKADDGTTWWKAGLPENYYEALSYGSGRVVICSSKEDQYSYVRPQGDLSLFTYHLCQALRGRAGVRADGLIRVLDVFHYVNEAVQADEHKQTPILKIKDLDLDFAIALDKGGKKGSDSTLVKPDVAAIRERIVGDPVVGAKILSDYLASSPEWATKRNEIDLKRADLERIRHETDLFGPNENDKAAKNRIVYFLLRVCLELEQVER